MRLSQTGIGFIKERESLSLKAYKDVAGLWTIGYGHLLKEWISPISEDQAELLLLADIIKAEIVVDSLSSLNQNQFDALVSFAFNVGTGAFLKSTLFKRLQIRDFHGAAEEFPKWKYSGGKIVQGLINRRKLERELFEKEDNE